MITVLYFARLREALGTGSEQLELPSGVADVAGLRALLRERPGPWSETLGGSRVLVAVNQEMASDTTAVADGDEVAFFPPVTGG